MQASKDSHASPIWKVGNIKESRLRIKYLMEQGTQASMGFEFGPLTMLWNGRLRVGAFSQTVPTPILNRTRNRRQIQSDGAFSDTELWISCRSATIAKHCQIGNRFVLQPSGISSNIMRSTAPGRLSRSHAGRRTPLVKTPADPHPPPHTSRASFVKRGALEDWARLRPRRCQATDGFRHEEETTAPTRDGDRGRHLGELFAILPAWLLHFYLMHSSRWTLSKCM
jgi:hypothetical protein